VNIPHRKTLAARLVRHYRNASEDTVVLGRNWYSKAYSVACDLAQEFDITVTQAAYVIAALSPNVAWPHNVASAQHACSGHKAGVAPSEYKGAGYGSNKAKAGRILNGDLTALSGPKVTQFAEGILGNPQACTVDVWMQRAVGLDATIPDSVNTMIRKAIYSAAKSVGETPKDFQAIVWTQVRNEHHSRDENYRQRYLLDVAE
jgi:hypothetical protein